LEEDEDLRVLQRVIGLLDIQESSVERLVPVLVVESLDEVEDRGLFLGAAFGEEAGLHA
jgi:hypothetical protein